jgi:hypothetical protein
MENIDILTASGMYNNPPSNAGQLTIALSIKLHTATRNPGVSINVNICSVKDNYNDVQPNGKTKISNLAEHKMKSRGTLSS